MMSIFKHREMPEVLPGALVGRSLQCFVECDLADTAAHWMGLGANNSGVLRLLPLPCPLLNCRWMLLLLGLESLD